MMLVVCVEYVDFDKKIKFKACDIEIENNEIKNINFFFNSYNELKLLNDNTKLSAFDSDTLKDYHKLQFKTLGELKNYYRNN